MSRALLVLIVFGLITTAEARTRYPEVMSEYDVANAACKAGPAEAPKTRSACKTRDLKWRELRDAGYTLERDETNPNGYVWR